MESNIGIKALADDYRDKRLRHEWLDAKAKEARQERDAAEAALLDGMALQELAAVKTDDGATFGIRRSNNYSCPADCKLELVQEFIGNGRMEQLTVQAGTLNKIMKEEVELNGGELPKRFSFLKVYEKVKLSATGLKKLRYTGPETEEEDYGDDESYGD